MSINLESPYVFLVIAAASSYLSLKFFIHFSDRLQLLDVSDTRKLHKGKIPLVGGLSIFCGIFASLCVFIDRHPELLYLFFASLVVLVVGVLDDRKPLSASSRLVFQIIASIILILGGVEISTAGWAPGYNAVNLPQWLSVIITILVVSGLINAINFLDGVDGLASGVSVVSLIFLFYFFSVDGLDLFSWICIICVVSIAPSLTHNLSLFGSQNKVFLGDSGSTLLGLILAWLSISALQSDIVEFNKQVAQPVTMLWVLAIPIMDISSVIMRRILSGISPFKPDRKHIHHALLRMGLSDKKVLLLITGMCVSFGLVGLSLEKNNIPEGVSFILFLCVWFAYYYYLSRFFNRDGC